MPRYSAIPAIASLVLLTTPVTAAESIEFVTEHLPEIAMDNRYASLPLWDDCGSSDPCIGIQAGQQRTHAGSFAIDGPLLALSMSRPLGKTHRLTGFVFSDVFDLRGGTERRPLDITFATPPLSLPADAEFQGLAGKATDRGLGLAVQGGSDWRWLPAFEWSAGLLWQRLELRRYSFGYEVTGGPDAGAAGTLDYGATYSHFAPFLGASWPVTHGDWRLAPRVHLAVPLPRRSLQGRITGSGFALAGDAATHGAGRHFGDPSVSLGLDVSYLPWRLTLDLGTALGQALVEPKIHEGVDHDWLVSAHWAF